MRWCCRRILPARSRKPSCLRAGRSSQLIRARKTRDETTQAASPRTKRVTGSTGHHDSAKTQTSIASGKGMVNNWPTYPAGRERRVLRAQRRRCATLSRNRGVADVMLDDIRREHDAVSGFRGEFADDKIFRQIIFHARKAADGLQHAPPGRDGWSNGEAHSFEHPRNKSTTPKIRVHAGGLEARPETWSRDGAIRACGNAKAIILKFCGDSSQQDGLTRTSLSPITTRS